MNVNEWGVPEKFASEFGGWDVEKLKADEEFMRKQRNRMMFKTLVLKKQNHAKPNNKTGHGLQEYLTSADLTDADNYFTRGLTFIGDMINDRLEGEGKPQITAEELQLNKTMAHRELYKTIGVKAYTTMLINDAWGKTSYEKPVPSVEDVMKQLEGLVPNEDELYTSVKSRVESIMRELHLKSYDPLKSIDPEGFEVNRVISTAYSILIKAERGVTGEVGYNWGGNVRKEESEDRVKAKMRATLLILDHALMNFGKPIGYMDYFGIEDLDVLKNGIDDRYKKLRDALVEYQEEEEVQNIRDRYRQEIRKYIVFY